MTKFFKTSVPAIIFAAVSLTAAISCSKQEAVSPETGSQGVGEQPVTLTATLPQSDTKTFLGTPGAGKYPTLWKTGDRISLNGYPSLPLSSEQEGGRSASFVFRGGLSSPFNILYPATTSCDTLELPAVQNYAAGTFDPSATPMWASTAKYEDVVLKHLSSLLRFDIKGDVTLGSISLSSRAGEALSGPFAMAKDGSGFYTGEISALDESRPDVELSFGPEGLALSETEATPIYVSVPAGTYNGGFWAVINAVDGAAMVISFFTSEGRSIEPSKVLHFDEFTFSDGGDDVIYIRTAEDLTALSGSDATKAYLMNDIDLGTTAWTSVGSWSGTFDGMGHSIKGTGYTHLFKLDSADDSLAVKDLTISGIPAFNIAAGSLSASGCDFTDAGDANTTEAVVKLGACEGSTITFSNCRFLNNRNNYNGGVTIQVMSTWEGRLYVNACRFCGNVNKQYGCVHTQAPASDLGGFVGLFDCLFYDNYGAASTASKATDGIDINLSLRHIVANSTFVSTSDHLSNMNVRCGSMAASSGAGKGSLYVNNIFVNEYSKGYSFNVAAADKYYLTLGGYNRYDRGAATVGKTEFTGVTFSESDVNTATSGTYDSATLRWTWDPTQADRDAMFAGGGVDLRDYLIGNADADYLRSYAVDFADWLDSIGAFDSDLYGNVRSGEKYWPGCYQGQ